MLPIYRHKDTFVHGLHPVAALTMTLTMAACALLLENPIYVAVICAAVMAIMLASEVWGECVPFMRIGLLVGVLMVIINPLINNQGAQVLVYGPHIPLWGHLDITLEAILYGLSSALRVFTVIAAFGLASTIVNPDDLLDMLSRFSLRSSLSAALAVRLYPSMVSEARELREVQMARGVPLKGGSRWSRVKAHAPLWYSMFQGSLDRAASIAESMTARGFGSGKRTSLRRRLIRPRDVIIIILSLTVMGVAIMAVTTGRGSYSFFPELENPLGNLSLAALVATAMAFSLIVFMSRSWKKWHWWRSKI
jgi:energy-coupling factor transport system permease protein